MFWGRMSNYRYAELSAELKEANRRCYVRRKVAKVRAKFGGYANRPPIGRQAVCKCHNCTLDHGRKVQ